MWTLSTILQNLVERGVLNYVVRVQDGGVGQIDPAISKLINDAASQVDRFSTSPMHSSNTFQLFDF